AYDVMREYKVLSGLKDSPVPVPRPLLACRDDSILGVPFYLMEYVPGVTVRYELPAAYAQASDDVRRQIALELIDTLAVLHRVRPEDVGLSDLGRSTGFMQRQLRRWCSQLEH